MIRAEGLTARADDGQRLDAASLQVAGGETIGIVGEDRSGGALLLQVLATLIAPVAGRLLIDGVDAVANPFAARRRVCWVGAPVLNTDLSVHEYFTLARAGRRLPDSRVARDTVLDDAGVRDADRLDTLPSGPRQLVDLVVAARSGAGLVILDHPMRALGATERALATRVLTGARAGGTTIVMASGTSHDLPVRCDRLFAMDDGRLTEMPSARNTGTPPHGPLDWGAR